MTNERITLPRAAEGAPLGGTDFVDALATAGLGYDTRDFVAALRARGVTPQVAQHTVRRHSPVGDRTTQHPGYSWSQRRRKRVEEFFG